MREIASEKDVNAAGEIAPVRGKELSELSVCYVGPHIARIEVVSEIEAEQRQTNSILLRNPELVQHQALLWFATG